MSGFSSEIYEILWKSEQHTKTQQSQVHLPPPLPPQSERYSFTLPHTILFKQGQPSEWYFSNELGQIKKKLKQATNISAIKMLFIQKYNASVGSLATMSTKNNNNSQNSNIAVAQFLEINSFHITYLDNASIKNELYNKDGILQLFVDPPSHRNCVIRAIQDSTSTLSIMRIMNKHNITDSNVAIQLRACTSFDSQARFIELETISGKHQSLIQLSLNEIVNHIARVKDIKPNQLEICCYFKQDILDRIYFLHCDILHIKQNTNTSSNAHSQRQFALRTLTLTHQQRSYSQNSNSNSHRQSHNSSSVNSDKLKQMIIVDRKKQTSSIEKPTVANTSLGALLTHPNSIFTINCQPSLSAAQSKAIIRTSKTKRSVSVNSTVYNSLSNELTQGSKEVLNNPSDKDELGDTATKKKNSSRSSHQSLIKKTFLPFNNACISTNNTKTKCFLLDQSHNYQSQHVSHSQSITDSHNSSQSQIQTFTNAQKTRSSTIASFHYYKSNFASISDEEAKPKLYVKYMKNIPRESQSQKSSVCQNDQNNSSHQQNYQSVNSNNIPTQHPPIPNQIHRATSNSCKGINQSAHSIKQQDQFAPNHNNQIIHIQNNPVSPQQKQDNQTNHMKDKDNDSNNSIHRNNCSNFNTCRVEISKTFPVDQVDPQDTLAPLSSRSSEQTIDEVVTLSKADLFQIDPEDISSTPLKPLYYSRDTLKINQENPIKQYLCNPQRNDGNINNYNTEFFPSVNGQIHQVSRSLKRQSKEKTQKRHSISVNYSSSSPLMEQTMTTLQQKPQETYISKASKDKQPNRGYQKKIQGQLQLKDGKIIIGQSHSKQNLEADQLQRTALNMQKEQPGKIKYVIRNHSKRSNGFEERNGWQQEISQRRQDYQECEQDQNKEYARTAQDYQKDNAINQSSQEKIQEYQQTYEKQGDLGNLGNYISLSVEDLPFPNTENYLGNNPTNKQQYLESKENKNKNLLSGLHGMQFSFIPDYTDNTKNDNSNSYCQGGNTPSFDTENQRYFQHQHQLSQTNLFHCEESDQNINDNHNQVISLPSNIAGEGNELNYPINTTNQIHLCQIKNMPKKIKEAAYNSAQLNNVDISQSLNTNHLKRNRERKIMTRITTSAKAMRSICNIAQNGTAKQ